ncbi:glycoside hydrolase family 3 C-terminal domain-containing protein [Isoptericola sp. 4D.3]|uniref:Glycoside hydrolase family 3 C-terminal domain-containing protein n=1 Tax=Isoptericola peretonis TaxID=2918523 RepID=A0ABT0J559_9MICO|nr:glycoside hydrolase family 3 C-terminal domain-containing protein [Isoptericola sp. 4D.3]
MTHDAPGVRGTWTDPARRRAAEVMAGMSLRERVGQLNQRLLGWQAVERTAQGEWRTTDLLREEVDRWGGLGALYGLFRADAWSGRGWADGIRPEARAEVAALVVEEVRAASGQDVGPLLVEEAPHGHQALGAELLPVNLAVGATWDAELYRQACASVATSLRADGVHLALLSTLDLLQDPRWGRSEECYGEVPALAARMTEAAVVGMQGHDRSRLADGTGVGVVLKHFAAQGAGTGGRNGHSAALGPRDLAELHLPAARAGVAAGALGLMAAYNDIDGVPCVANRALLTDLLRGEWGFDGLVMADGLAVDRIVEQVGDPVAAAATALRAGVDLSLWDRSFTMLEEAVAQSPDLLSRAVDEACLRVLTVKARSGLLGPVDEAQPSDRPATGDLSVAIAARSVVLLRNEPAAGADRPALPVAPGGRWVVTGPRADDVDAMLGDYVAPLAPDRRVSVADALTASSGAHGVVVERADADDVAAVAAADGVVVVLGGSSHRAYTDEFADNGANAGQTAADCGEGVDIASPVLPAGQVETLAAVRAAARGPVVAVVLAGRPYVLTDVVAHSDAVLLAFYPGPGGGRVIADLLLGARQPVGRLPVTLPAHPGAIPVRDDERMPAEGVYRDVPEPVLARVGDGIGYGGLDVHGVRLSVSGEDLLVEADVRAVRGDWHGEGLLLVRSRRVGGLDWARTVVVGWERASVAPGDGAQVSVRVPVHDVLRPDLPLAVLGDRRARIEVALAGRRWSFDVTQDGAGEVTVDGSRA